MAIQSSRMTPLQSAIRLSIDHGMTVDDFEIDDWGMFEATGYPFDPPLMFHRPTRLCFAMFTDDREIPNLVPTYTVPLGTFDTKEELSSSVDVAWLGRQAIVLHLLICDKTGTLPGFLLKLEEQEM